MNAEICRAYAIALASFRNGYEVVYALRGGPPPGYVCGTDVGASGKDATASPSNTATTFALARVDPFGFVADSRAGDQYGRDRQENRLRHGLGRPEAVSRPGRSFPGDPAALHKEDAS